ncbi:MAG TPA: YceI family protein, partial [Urbifossiella sp.]|nr:YceI family protein [Urbifossiella sp.]
MRRYELLVVLVAAWAGGCSTRLDPTRPAPAAPAARPAGAGATPAAAGKAVPLSADNTRVTFIGTAGKTSHEGTFDRLSGTWELPTDDPKDSRLSVRIETDSLRTKIALLTAHLKRADFLDVQTFPVATFASTRIDPDPSGSGVTTYRVTGEFTIHGVTRTVAFPARLVVGPDAAALEGTFPVSQTAFGMA